MSQAFESAVRDLVAVLDGQTGPLHPISWLAALERVKATMPTADLGVGEVVAVAIPVETAVAFVKPGAKGEHWREEQEIAFKIRAAISHLNSREGRE